jgi:preprotein translocase subunit YajC
MTTNEIKNTSEIKVGTKVMKDGYEGTVTRVCEWDTDMVEVRLASGTVCVGKSNFSGQYENNYIIAL